MDVERVKELIDLMKENDLSELEIVDGQTRIILKRGNGSDAPQMYAVPASSPANIAPPAAAPAPATATETPAAESADSNLKEIVSPIVGTFYAAPSPNADAFVDVGDSVGEDTVVCIVEAMKVMNEINSEIKGTIKKVLVSNGTAVEFGQPLFLVEPD